MQHFIGPRRTPKVIQLFLWITAVCSLLYPVLTYFLSDAYKIHGFGLLFPLSYVGVTHGYVWQLVTYVFFHSIGSGFSLFFLVSLFFHLFLLWFGGCEVAERYGPGRFILFYLGSALFAGLVTLLYFWIFNHTGVIVGSSPAVYALIMLWGMVYPKLTLHMFLVMRIEARWIVLLLLALSLLFNIFAAEFSYFIADLAGMLFGFFVGRYLCKLPNPYWPKH